MKVLGVDPGASGALALVEDGRLVDVFDMPTVTIRRGKSDKTEVDGYALGDLLRELAVDVGCVELVGGMTGESASGAFNFGRAAGAPEYAMKALGIRVERAAPAAWRRAMRVPKGKEGSLARASALWPWMAGRWAAKRGNGPARQREGRAEACLIAQYAYEEFCDARDEQPRKARMVEKTSAGDIFA